VPLLVIKIDGRLSQISAELALTVVEDTGSHAPARR
jgi:hypothetical protein